MTSLTRLNASAGSLSINSCNFFASTGSSPDMTYSFSTAISQHSLSSNKTMECSSQVTTHAGLGVVDRFHQQVHIRCVHFASKTLHDSIQARIRSFPPGSAGSLSTGRFILVIWMKNSAKTLTLRGFLPVRSLVSHIWSARSCAFSGCSGRQREW